jgi:hypothetical protein
MTDAQSQSLKDFLPKKSNVVFLNNANQVDKSKPHVVLAGAGWYGYSQLGVPQFSTACNDLKDTKGTCYVADVTIPECKNAIDSLGLKPSAFPDHFVWNPKTKKYDEMLGMRKVPELKKELASRGFAFD